MPLKRRKKIGATLLVAGAGVTVSMTGACIGVSGNLMSPPMVPFCIEVEPEDAEVYVEATVVANGECVEYYQGDHVTVTATADGYQDYEEEVVVSDDPHVIEMVPEAQDTAGEE